VAQRLDSRSRRTATPGLCDPQNAPRFSPTAPNRQVFHQASKKAVRFSIRSRKALLSPVSRLVRCVWPFWAECYRCASCRAESRETTRLTGPCPARKPWGTMEWTGLVSLVSQLERSCPIQNVTSPETRRKQLGRRSAICEGTDPSECRKIPRGVRSVSNAHIFSGDVGKAQLTICQLQPFWPTAIVAIPANRLFRRG